MEKNTRFILYIFFLDSTILLNGKNLGTKILETINFNTNVLKLSDNANIHRFATVGYNKYVLKIPILNKKNNNEFLDLERNMLNNKAFLLLNQRTDFLKKNTQHPQIIWTENKEDEDIILTKSISLSSKLANKLNIDDYNTVYKISCLDENKYSIYQYSKSFVTLITESKIPKNKIDEVLLPPFTDINSKEITNNIIYQINNELEKNSSLFNIEEDFLNLKNEYLAVISLEDGIEKNDMLDIIGKKFMLLKNLSDINISEI